MRIRCTGNHAWLYQWDLDQRVMLEECPSAIEVQFSSASDGTEHSLKVKPYTVDNCTYADVPNILLQHAGNITAYICDIDGKTLYTKIIEVRPKEKPDDYVYTETEVLSYETLSKRIDELEKNGVSEEQIKAAVDKYLEENPIDTGVPDVDGAEDGSVLTIENGKAEWKQLPKYDGEYEVTPSTDNARVLQTGQKFVDADIKVKKIPFYEFDNTAGGTTIYIGSEDELIIE